MLVDRPHHLQKDLEMVWTFKIETSECTSLYEHRIEVGAAGNRKQDQREPDNMMLLI